MGLRFRKSYKVGPFRVNLSKSGIGWSVGTKGLRYTKMANGKSRTTTSIPGTGISYSTDYSPQRKKTPEHPVQRPTSSDPWEVQKPDEKKRGRPFMIAMVVFVIALVIVAVGVLLPRLNADEAISTDVIPENSIWYPGSEIRFLSYPGNVHPGDTVGLTAKGKPNTSYAISVYTDTGMLSDYALVSVVSNWRGECSWDWTVPKDTAPGIYYIRVSDRSGNKNCVDYAVLDSNGTVVGEAPSRVEKPEETQQGLTFEIEAIAPAASQGLSTVYITDSGTKYHRSGCQHVNSSKRAIDISAAISAGYSACGACRP